MIQRLLNFLDASPVNFLAVQNIVRELEQNGFRPVSLGPCILRVEVALAALYGRLLS